MIITRKTKSVVTVLLTFAFVASGNLIAQDNEKPLFSSYKGVTIGMSMDEARSKLGSPKDKSDEQDSYVFSNDETAQIYYDAAKKVNAMTVTYTGKLSEAPAPKAIFGSDAQVKPDGGIFRMERYPKAGYWVSYNKIMGDEPLILIAIKKL